jgi:hypothetical protein
VKCGSAYTFLLHPIISTIHGFPADAESLARYVPVRHHIVTPFSYDRIKKGLVVPEGEMLDRTSRSKLRSLTDWENYVALSPISSFLSSTMY